MYLEQEGVKMSMNLVQGGQCTWYKNANVFGTKRPMSGTRKQMSLIKEGPRTPISLIQEGKCL
jgi:hypothetical protein